MSGLSNRLYKNIFWFIKLNLPLGKKAFFIGTPEYTNLGDSAIAIAQVLFLCKCGYKRNSIKEITQSEYINFSGLINRYISKRHLICGIGGGNLGNQWYNEELFRYSFIDSFPGNPIIIFPQTVFFTNDINGQKATEISKEHYEKPDDLTIVAREKISFKLLTSLYHKPQKLLTPDIVLSTTMKDYGVTISNRSGCLLVFREDVERTMSETDRKIIVNRLNENNVFYRKTDMYATEPVNKNNRMELVRKKMQEFADSEFVITDRLHGMIFAAITETPCIVFSNNHHKIQETYRWISYLDYIRYVHNTDEAIELIPELMNMKNCHFNNQPLMVYYDDLLKEVSQYVN